MDVKCQCGRVAFKTPTAEPLSLYHCHCIDCQKQSSSAFGTSAIFPADGIFPLSPDLDGRLRLWNRPSKDGRTIDCYFCAECGVRVMHRIREADGLERATVSVKGGLVEGLDWPKAGHIFTRSAVVPIPETAVQYAESPPAASGRK